MDVLFNYILFGLPLCNNIGLAFNMLMELLLTLCLKIQYRTSLPKNRKFISHRISATVSRKLQQLPMTLNTERAGTSFCNLGDSALSGLLIAADGVNTLCLQEVAIFASVAAVHDFDISVALATAAELRTLQSMDDAAAGQAAAPTFDGRRHLKTVAVACRLLIGRLRSKSPLCTSSSKFSAAKHFFSKQLQLVKPLAPVAAWLSSSIAAQELSVLEAIASQWKCPP